MRDAPDPRLEQSSPLRRLSAACLCRAQVKSLTAPAPFVDLAMRVMKLEEALQRRQAQLLRGREAFNAAVQIMDREQKALLREALGFDGQARPHSAAESARVSRCDVSPCASHNSSWASGLSPLWHSLQC